MVLEHPIGPRTIFLHPLLVNVVHVHAASVQLVQSATPQAADLRALVTEKDSLLAGLLRGYVEHVGFVYSALAVTPDRHPGLGAILDTLTATSDFVLAWLRHHGRDVRDVTSSLDATGFDDDGLSLGAILAVLEEVVIGGAFPVIFGWYKRKFAAEDLTLVTKRQELCIVELTLEGLEVPHCFQLGENAVRLPTVVGGASKPYADVIVALEDLFLTVGDTPRSCSPTHLLRRLVVIVDEIQATIRRSAGHSHHDSFFYFCVFSRFPPFLFARLPTNVADTGRNTARIPGTRRSPRTTCC